MPEFIDAHGVAIVYDVHPAITAPRAVVQLLHGVGEHAGRYGTVIAQLTAHGYTVYADDHRGHGRTGIRQHGDPTRLGRLGRGGMPATVAALTQFTELIRAENPDLPLVLLGHSWGSFLAQILVNDDPEEYDAVVLTGTALRWPGSLNAGALNAPWKGPDATGREWLSSDPAVGAAFGEDPLTTDRPLLALFGPIDAARLFGRPARGLRDRRTADLPVLIMVGREDTVGGAASAHRLARAYRDRSGLDDITTLIYPGARHEVFNEVQQADVRADLLAWLEKRFPVRA
ncbi:MAG: alpha/beta fold hydrolase [Microbacterium sp.]|uniref:alpha/beta fold hydrolase n=1 Tax=Microbacterium sp. TaxID=51671 RepID=UPI00271F2C93|nr:alpha/beta fold hydrolase [Microbacterium sp.]MDO8384593.1 alpha/beta fold hydrolase [Microbacterium sp.]